MSNRRKFINVFFVAFFIFSITSDAQIISTFAGNGNCGDSGDNGPATDANIEIPAGGAFDAKGNYYFLERLSNKVRKVSTTGVISNFAGTGTAGFSGDDGPATIAALNTPAWVAADGSGNVYIADNGNHRIRRVDSNGVIRTIAGNGIAIYSGDGGAATSASLYSPNGICVDDSGNIYESEVGRIRKINNYGIINTFAGSGIPGYSGDGGVPIVAQINAYNIALDQANNLYLADMDNYRVRKININTNTISTIAGNGIQGYNGDNIPATSAELGETFAVAVDVYGNVFISDWNQRIRRVDKNGIITTLAGDGTTGYNGDGIQAGLAEIHDPEGIVFDQCGNLYFTDANNCRVRKVTFAKCNYLGIVETTSSDKLEIYPNPSYNQLNINNLNFPSSYRVLNTPGATMQQGTLHAGDNSISLQSLPDGLYMLEIIDEQKNRTITKILKQGTGL